MKKFVSILFFLLIAAGIYAQAPEKMSYQAVIRNSSNQLVTNQSIGMQISILQGSVSGASVYVETQTPATNANGLVSIEIGNGTVVSGDFATIDWANGPYFIQTETDPTGGTSYTISGVSQLLSVPYAMYAKTAENIAGGITESDPIFSASDAAGITSGDISNWNGKLDAEVDGSVTNEIQALSISNDTIYLSNGGFVKLPAGFDGDYNSLANKPDFTGWDTNTGDDFDGQYSSLTGVPTNVSTFTNDAGYLTAEVDGSVTNEIQALSISNDTIYLSNGGFVKLPAGFDGDYNSLANKPDFTGWDTNAGDDFDGQYSSLTGVPTNVSTFTNDAGYLTSEVDGSVTNEIQALSISNDTIYLSNGGFVKLPAETDPAFGASPAAGITGTNITTWNSLTPSQWTTGGSDIYYSTGKVGIGKIPQYGLLDVAGSINMNSGNTIKINNVDILGNKGTGNIFVGEGAGNATTTGSNLVAIGYYAGYSNNVGSQVFIGSEAGRNNTSNGHTFVGYQAGKANTTGSNNTFVGQLSGYQNSTGGSNSFFGTYSGWKTTLGSQNVFSGYASGSENTEGGNNVFLGYLAGYGNTTGNNNISIGCQSGMGLSTGSYNIIIGNAATSGDANTIRIGNANQTKTFLAGVYNVTPAGGTKTVVIDANGQLGTATSNTTTKFYKVSGSTMANSEYDAGGGLTLTFTGNDPTSAAVYLQAKRASGSFSTTVLTTRIYGSGTQTGEIFNGSISNSSYTTLHTSTTGIDWSYYKMDFSILDRDSNEKWQVRIELDGSTNVYITIEYLSM